MEDHHPKGWVCTKGWAYIYLGQKLSWFRKCQTEFTLGKKYHFTTKEIMAIARKYHKLWFGSRFFSKCLMGSQVEVLEVDWIWDAMLLRGLIHWWVNNKRAVRRLSLVGKIRSLECDLVGCVSISGSSLLILCPGHDNLSRFSLSDLSSMHFLS